MAYRNRVSTDDWVGPLAFVGVAALILVSAYGWIMNVVKLAAGFNEPLTAMEVARGFGVFIAPLGVIFGFL